MIGFRGFHFGLERNLGESSRDCETKATQDSLRYDWWREAGLHPRPVRD